MCIYIYICIYTHVYICMSIHANQVDKRPLLEDGDSITPVRLRQD